MPLSRLYVTSLSFVLLFLISCSPNDPVPANKTKTDLLVQSPWKFKSAIGAGIDFVVDPSFSCFADNILTFSANLTGSTNEGAVACSPSIAGNFTWQFQSAESTLSLSKAIMLGTTANDYLILSLTENEMVLGQSVPIITANGVSQLPLIVTLRH